MLTPAQVKDILNNTAQDVTAGHNFMGELAGPGYDLATGHGLADAHEAVLAAGLTNLPIEPLPPIPLVLPVPPLPLLPLPGPLSLEGAAAFSAPPDFGPTSY